VIRLRVICGVSDRAVTTPDVQAAVVGGLKSAGRDFPLPRPAFAGLVLHYQGSLPFDASASPGMNHTKEHNFLLEIVALSVQIRGLRKSAGRLKAAALSARPVLRQSSGATILVA
jgi:hypothetical protein